MTNNTAAQTFFSNQSSGSNNGRPKAFLNVLFFDERFKFDETSSYSQQISGLGGTPNPGQIVLTGGSEKKAAKNGYCYVYISNETDDMVYFDNFTLKHKRGPLLEETHYYPFGLTMAGISSKAFQSSSPDCGCPSNKKGFNGNEIQNKEFNDGSGLELYDFNARTYDQQIGRFIQIDPLTDDEKQEGLTPYQFGWNSPVRYSDPDGKCPGCWRAMQLAKLKASQKNQESSSATTSIVSTTGNVAKGAHFALNGQYTVFQTQQGVGLKDAKLANPKTGKAGQVVVRTDAPHKGANYPHINQNPLATGRPDPHTPITNAQFNALNKTGQVLEGISKVAKPVAIVTDGVQIANAIKTDIEQETGGDNTIVATSKVAGGWVGAIGGAKGGAVAGAAIGSIFPGPGTAIGGFVGGIIGGIGGGNIWIGNWRSCRRKNC